MTKITHAKDLARARRGAATLLVALPAGAAGPQELTRLLGSELGALARSLAKSLEPGQLGASASTLAGGDPDRLELALLPDALGRHNSPARAECIRLAVKRAGLTRAGQHGLLLVLDEAAHVPAAVCAAARALPLFDAKTGRSGRSRVRIACVDRRGSALPVTAATRAVADSVREAAKLVDTPPSDLDPAALARSARALLRGMSGVRVREIAGSKLLEAGLRGIHTVGRAARSAPRLLVATWKPTRRPRHSLHVALVGKGVTYDTGGLSLKTGGHMLGMKSDMGGAAACLGAFRALARSDCPHRLTLVLCLAENAVGPASYKPDDVIEMHSGKTVEINNTDAEGRLLLADGVSWAARVAKADVVIDAATLTGAQLIATGEQFAAVVSDDAALETELVRAGRRSGDLLHPLPCAPEFFRSEFESPVADMRNSVKNRMNAQSSCAAEFVHWHMEGTSARWAHIDLAGPAFRGERGTGFGVALLATCVPALRPAVP